MVTSTNRTDYIVTNDMTQSDTDEAQKASGRRWEIEQFHREAKQITGIEYCQYRLNRSQRNHIASALLVRVAFKERLIKPNKRFTEMNFCGCAA
ncbi:MAG: transposase [Pyrinomonadaceae bacterium]|nr:transposase [Pyrinomonadaceae bacterium]